VEVYLDYLANLLSAQVCHMEDALAALAQALLGPTAATRTTSGEVDDACYSNLHSGLQTLLEIVPRAAAQLVSALNKHYPFRTRGSDIQEVAVRNCLHVTTYCPTMTEDILCLLIKKMINIDAEIRLDDESSMELVIDEEGEPQFHVDMEQEPLMMSQGGGIHSTIGESSSTPGSETTPTENGCRGDEATPPHLGPSLSKHRVMRNDLSENLDIHMTVLQNHMKSVCFHDGQLVTEEAVALLQTLFKIFSNVILPTHAISHVQFLVFYLTSFHKEFPGVFLDFLWKKFQDVSSSAVLRQTTATYMASYIARSKFVSVETARLCLVHMMNWLHQYLDMCDPSTLGPFVARHGPFFSLCQSVFYIFVFRHQSLVEMENGLSFLRSLNFERIVSSKLNPLQVSYRFLSSLSL
jgi:RNA polymerase I-specific transcription initiation factor RRN3